MIYERPTIRPGGDRYAEIELGDEMSFDLNFRVHSLSAAKLGQLRPNDMVRFRQVSSAEADALRRAVDRLCRADSLRPA